jgi:hypothetical protein
MMVAAGSALAQTPPDDLQERGRKLAEGTWKYAHEVLLKDFQRSYTEQDTTLVDDVGSLVPGVARLFPEVKFKDDALQQLQRRKDFVRMSFNVPQGRTAGIRRMVMVEFTPYSSLKASEDGWAWRVATLQVRFQKGTFTNRPIGEIAAHYLDHDQGATLYFLRRNVVISVDYSASYEEGESRDPSGHKIRVITRWWRDPAIVYDCEDLAAKVDDLVQRWQPSAPK